MGFKDLQSFNVAMLANQAWCLLTQPNSLISRIYRHKYYRNDTILSAKSSTTISFAFRSILGGRDLLSRGLMWKLGDGRSIDLFHDRWLPRPTTFSLVTPAPEISNLKVLDFICNGSWNVNRLRTHLWEIDVDLITTLDASRIDREDEQVWMFSDSDAYSVSMGYKLHRSLECPQPKSSSSRNRSWLRNVWSLKIPQKVSVPVWRLWIDSLPVAARINHRGLRVVLECSFCGKAAECENHLFLHCPVILEVLDRVLPSYGLRREMLQFRKLWAVTVWVVWYCRNRIRFKGEKHSVNGIVDTISRHFKFFTNSAVINTNLGSVQESSTSSKWAKPPEGWVKDNCDAAVRVGEGKESIGCVLHDEMGEFIVGRCTRPVYSSSVLLMELKSIKDGLNLAREVGYMSLIVESDSACAIQYLNQSPSLDGEMMNELKEELNYCRGFSPWFDNLILNHISRAGNSLAHLFAQKALEVEFPGLFIDKPD